MNSLLVAALLDPQRTLEFSHQQFGQLIREGRSSGLLASLGLLLDDAGLLEQLDSKVARHLQSAIAVHLKHTRDVRYEIKWLRRALDTVNAKLILLKGAAYFEAGMDAGRGRLLADIDILAPRNQIATVESALNDFGWKSGELDAYNKRYYRQWMHEIPPLGHPKRGSTIDLHHTILPPTAGPSVDARLLFETVCETRDGVFTLAPIDMVIHSATHLFHEGEFHHGLRDLWDLHCMLRDFSQSESGFWQQLVPRAKQLDLLDPLFHSLRYTQLVFQTEVPTEVIDQASSRARRVRQPLMDFLFRRAFQPPQPECRRAFTATALFALYIRSHYLKMPMYLLLPHLIRKAWMKRFPAEDSTDAESAK